MNEIVSNKEKCNNNKEENNIKNPFSSKTVKTATEKKSKSQVSFASAVHNLPFIDYKKVLYFNFRRKSLAMRRRRKIKQLATRSRKRTRRQQKKK